MNRLPHRILSLFVTLALVTNSFFLGDSALMASLALADEETPQGTTPAEVELGSDQDPLVDDTPGDDSGTAKDDSGNGGPADTSSDAGNGLPTEGDEGKPQDGGELREESEEGLNPGTGGSDEKRQNTLDDSSESQNEAEDEKKEETLDDVSPEAAAPSVSVLTHVQRQGWATSWATNGAVAGTTGRSLRLEAIRLRLEGLGGISGSIRYRSHVQSEGWQGWVAGDAVSGSTGKARRIEALQIELQGDVAKDYDVWYRLHCQRLGWMAWAKNGEVAGTAGRALRAEAIQVVLVKHGNPAPDASGQNTNVAFSGIESIKITPHVQRLGWMGAVYSGQVAGTTGRALRLEAIKTSLEGARAPGGVQVSAHVQGIGWMGWAGNGQVAGTTGQAKRAEAFKMHLTGEAAGVYDLYYRVHVQKVGWLAWASEDQVAGSEGLALRAEAIQTILVPQGAGAPSNADASYSLPSISAISIGTSSYVSGGWQGYAWNGGVSGTTGRRIPNQGLRIYLAGTNAQALGGVSYRVHLQGGGWQSWTSNNGEAGPNGGIDAFQVQLSGTASKVYNVWYRAHCQSYGWMGWACNGAPAGTTGLNKRLEAVQIMLVSKTRGAPGATTGAYVDGALRGGLDAASGARSVTSFGGYSASGGVTNALNNAINGIRGRGYDVGFIMMDLSSHKGVAYNCDALFYGASSIKAPYLGSVVSQHPDSVVRYANDMTETLFYSWDYNYKNVLAAYGKGPMYAYCSEAGVRQSIADALPWVNYSARELAKLWARNYQLFAQSSAGEQLGRWCERPNTSTIHTTLGGKYRTRSKAGWLDDGEYTVVAGVNGGGPLYKVSDDGGIVYARNGAYVVAIMSSVPADHDMLNGLTAAIDAAHNEM